jgi:oxalate decarboxylase/phosphoglucose isomerase-like protein (cupin superfamily)
MRVGTDDITIRVYSDETGGALVAADVRMPAGGGPPLLHRHGPAEVYRVDRGELAIYLEDGAGAVRRHVTRAGEVVHIPAARAHTIRNESTADAEAYVIFTPGATMERFVHAAAALGADATPDAIVAVAEGHGVTFAGPVPAAG